MKRYSIAPWHGASGSLFYVIAHYSEDEHDWGIVASFTTRERAEAYLKKLEAK